MMTWCATPAEYSLFQFQVSSPLSPRRHPKVKTLPIKPSQLPIVSAMADPEPIPMTIDGSDQDLALARSQHLTRYEVLTRRSWRVKQLARVYRDHYWSLMEKVMARYRDYYWVYGISPFKEDEKKTIALEKATDGAGEKGRFGVGTGYVEGKCAVAGCKVKAMALTRFCHAHILSDSKQKLYTGCTYVIKRFTLSFNS